MNAPPNADFLDDDEDDEDMSPSTSLESYEQVAASDEFEEMLIKMGADESTDSNWSDDILMKIAGEDREEDRAGAAVENGESKIVSVADIDVLEMDTLDMEEDSDLTAGSIDNEQ